jgi:hypothetical protein
LICVHDALYKAVMPSSVRAGFAKAGVYPIQAANPLASPYVARVAGKSEEKKERSFIRIDNKVLTSKEVIDEIKRKEIEKAKKKEEKKRREEVRRVKAEEKKKREIEKGEKKEKREIEKAEKEKKVSEKRGYKKAEEKDVEQVKEVKESEKRGRKRKMKEEIVPDVDDARLLFEGM